MDINIKKYYDIFDNIFWRAFDSNGFETMCTVIRVSTVSSFYWDVMKEAFEAIDDYNWLLEKAKLHSENATLRVLMLMYCQLIEMTPPIAMLTNLLKLTKTG